MRRDAPPELDYPEKTVSQAPPRRTLLIRGSLLAVAAALFAGSMILIAQVPPTASSFYPKCMSYTMLGIHCPGCGLTRATHSLANLEVAQAVAWNPFAVLVLPYLGLILMRMCWLWLWDIRSDRTLISSRIGWSLVGVMILFGIARNIPIEPFTLLAPHTLSP